MPCHDGPPLSEYRSSATMSTKPGPGQYADGPFAPMNGVPWPCGFHTIPTRPEGRMSPAARSGGRPAPCSLAFMAAPVPPRRMTAIRRNARTNWRGAYVGPRERPDSSNAHHAFQEPFISGTIRTQTSSFVAFRAAASVA